MGIFGANYGANYNLVLDTTNPTVSIVSPIDLSTQPSSFTVSGTAADETGLLKVEVQVDSGGFQLATGTTNWSISLSGLLAGARTITAKATDTSLNTGTDVITVTVDLSLDTPPTTSISHVTLDAGVDLRKRNRRGRQTQVLRLSNEIPISGTAIKKQKLVITLEGMCKRTEKLSIPSLLIMPQKIKTPITGTLFTKQKSLFSVSGNKGYSKAIIRSTDKQRKLAKIDTLKELLRELDEE